MKKWLGIIGLGALVGAAAYFIYNTLKGEGKSDPAPQQEQPKAEQEPQPEQPHETVAATMQERHTEAAKVIKDSVEVILKNTEVQETEDLDRMSDAFDDLLKG